MASCFLYVFFDRNGVDVHKHAKKETQNQERGLNPEGTNKLITDMPQRIYSAAVLLAAAQNIVSTLGLILNFGLSEAI